ncbi:tetratricopeptide repeat protein [Swingsia samuiensis]|uniref:Uncharacterized protein n=1 Tax=Swingsia samuiensis TaxID=1293412 RepID=A0A4Y6UIV3_9PROT|nr:hypothetical protein [Swingsia samuiensis]QDH16558.1 hypothetical protein E3D00_02435 [Swingsia samuiensis]
MQITREWPKTIFSLTKRGLSSAFLASALLVNAEAAPQIKTLPTIDPDKSLTGWILASNVMMQRGHIDAAYNALNRILALSGNNLTYHEQTLHYALMSGHEEEALQLAKTLPNHDIATFILVQNAASHKNWDEMRHLLNHNSHHGMLISTAQPVFLAWALAEEGHIQQALDTLHSASSFAGTRRLYQLHAALISERLPDDSQAKALYQKVGSSPDDPLLLQILYTQAYSSWLETKHQHQAAIDCITALGVNSPLASLTIGPLQHNLKSRPPLSSNQGLAILDFQIALMLNDVIQQEGLQRDPAIITLKQALYFDPSLTVARIFLADIFRDNQQITEGLEELSHIPNTDPLAALAAQERVNLASSSHDLNREAQALYQALEILPDNPDFLTQLAEVEDELGHHNEAIVLFTSAIKASPPRKEALWPLLLGRAMAEEELGNWINTRADMHRALELAPNQPEVLNFVGYGNIEHNEDQENAISLLKRALQLEPNNPSIQDSYAWALLKHTGDLKTSLPILIQAAEHSSSDPEIGYHLGVAYWYLGRQTEAKDQWNQSLDDHPLPQDKALLLNALQQNGPHLPIFETKK